MSQVIMRHAKVKETLLQALIQILYLSCAYLETYDKTEKEKS